MIKKTLKNIVLALSASALLTLNGCVVFPAGHVPKTVFTDSHSNITKPTVYVSVMGYRGSPKNPTPMPTADPIYREMVYHAFVESGIFHNVYFDPAKKDDADIKMNVRIYEETHVGEAFLSALVSYLTLTIVPNFGYISSTAEVSMIDSSDNIVSTVTESDSTDQLAGVLTIPVYVFSHKTMHEVGNSVITNEVAAGLLEQYKNHHIDVNHVSMKKS